MKKTTETRLDTIEQYVAEFAKGMLEFRDGMLEARQGIQEARQGIREVREGMQEFRDGMLEVKGDLQELRDDLQQMREGLVELKEAQLKTDAQIQSTLKALGDLGLVQGEVAEDLFYRNVKGLFTPLDLRFQRIRRNVKIKGQGEYDIVADDLGRVLVIEVKNKLSRRMVDEFTKNEVTPFQDAVAGVSGQQDSGRNRSLGGKR